MTHELARQDFRKRHGDGARRAEPYQDEDRVKRPQIRRYRTQQDERESEDDLRRDDEFPDAVSIRYPSDGGGGHDERRTDKCVGAEYLLTGPAELLAERSDEYADGISEGERGDTEGEADQRCEHGSPAPSKFIEGPGLCNR